MAGIDRAEGFVNGRSARGLLEQAISAQAIRLRGPASIWKRCLTRS
jgi:hypothetical protein